MKKQRMLALVLSMLLILQSVCSISVSAGTFEDNESTVPVAESFYEEDSEEAVPEETAVGISEQEEVQSEAAEPESVAAEPEAEEEEPEAEEPVAEEPAAESEQSVSETAETKQSETETVADEPLVRAGEEHDLTASIKGLSITVDGKEVTEVEPEDAVTVKFNWLIEGSDYNADDIYVYQLPARFRINQAATGDVKRGDEVIGSFEVNIKGKVSVKYNAGYNPTQESTANTMEILGFADYGGNNDPHEMKFDYDNKEVIIKIINDGDFTIKKSSKKTYPDNELGTDSTVEYEIVLSSVYGTNGPFTVGDVMSVTGNFDSVTLDAGSLTITDENGNAVTGWIPSVNGNNFGIVNIPALGVGGTYTIKYKVDVKRAKGENTAGNFWNRATATSGGISKNSDRTVTYTAPVSKSSGGYVAGKGLQWSAYVRTDGTDLAGYTFTDTADANITGVTINAVDSAGNGIYKSSSAAKIDGKTFTFTFPSGYPSTVYWEFIYYTEANFDSEGKTTQNNTAVLKHPSGIYEWEKGAVGVGEYVAVTLDKDSQGYIDNGDGTMSMYWDYEVQYTNLGRTSVTVGDTIAATQYYDRQPNYASWGGNYGAMQYATWDILDRDLKNDSTGLYVVIEENGQEKKLSYSEAIAKGYRFSIKYYIRSGYNDIRINEYDNTARIRRFDITVTKKDESVLSEVKAIGVGRYTTIFSKEHDLPGMSWRIWNTVTSLGKTDSTYASYSTTALEFTKQVAPVKDLSATSWAYTDQNRTYDYDESNGKLRYRVIATVPDDTETMVITDKLPEGMSIEDIGAAVPSWSSVIRVGTFTGTVNSKYDNQWTEGWTADNRNENISIQYPSADNGNTFKVTINNIGPKLYLRSNKMIAIEYVVDISEDLMKLSGTTVSSDGTDYVSSHTFTNSATDGTTDTSIETTIQKKEKILDKTGIQEVSSSGAYSSTVKYSVKINPESIDLLEDGDVLNYTDSLTSDYLDVELIRSSIQLYLMNQDGSKGTAVEPDYLRINDAVKGDDGTVTISYDLGIDDETAYILEYEYTADRRENSNRTAGTFNNAAAITGIVMTDSDVAVKGISARASSDSGALRFHKVDADNYTRYLTATFDLEEYDPTSDTFSVVESGIEISGENGVKYDFYNANCDLKGNVLYRVVETTEPVGYEKETDPTKYTYFIINGSIEDVRTSHNPNDLNPLTEAALRTAAYNDHTSVDGVNVSDINIRILPGDDSTNIDIANDRIPETVDVKVTKKWEDNNNQDGIRPLNITVKLLKNKEDSGLTKQLNEGTSWTATFEKLPKYEKGEEVVYSIEEVEVAGYTSEMKGDVSEGFEITNTHEPETISISGKKTWNDNNNADGNRPASINVHLLRAGISVWTKTITEQDGWKWSFDNLPKYEDGNEIRYGIFEEKVTGYTPEYGGTGNYDITNNYTPDTISIRVEKSWDDNFDQDGIRPESVTVILQKNGKDTDITKELNLGTNWEAVFSDLKEYENGKKVTYSVREASVPTGYTSSTRPTVDGGFVIVNTHEPETTTISGTKTWDDNNDQDGKRPDEIVVHLLKAGQTIDKKTVTAKDGWKYEFKDLPKYENGSEIRYGVSEETVDGYSPFYGGAGNYNIRNSYTPGKVAISVEKSWLDNNNQDGIRPQNVTVVLVKNGKDTDVTKQLNAGTNWEAVFRDLDEYENGQKITYTVRESTVPTGYSSAVRGDMTVGYTITNTHTPETTKISGTKHWNDNDDQDGKRPDEITIHLLKAGQVIQTKVVKESDNWKYEFTNLPKYENGAEIRYGVSEDSIEGYSPVLGGAGNYDITNNYTPETVAVSVVKSWLDNSNQDGIRPQSVTVILVKNGKDTDITKELNAGTNWEAVFRDLDKYENGEEITYTVRESEVPAGYTAAIRSNGSGGYTITNTHTPETTTISGTKSWNDSNNQDGKRPSQIVVHLLKAGQSIATKTVTAADGWKYEFKDLPKYENGAEIRYGISEEAVEGYSPVYGGAGNYDITNNYTPGKVAVSVEKSWLDNNNQDGIRPQNVTVVLVKNGEDTDVTKQLNAGTNWEAVFRDLDEYENGQKITYTVRERGVPNGYTAAVRGNMTVGYTITNTHTPETTTISGVKSWNDANDQDGKRPSQIVVHLLKAGQSVATKTVTAADGWQYEFKDLPKYENGVEIRYGISEEAVEGYSPVYGGAGNYNITNNYTPGKVAVSVEKSWLDNNNQDGIRPQNITVILVKNGEDTNITKQLNAGTNWEAVFRDLDEYENGKKITYTVRESTVPTGYTAAVRGDMPLGYTITNTHTPETTTVAGTKHWSDNDDQDGKRPSLVIVHLLKSGQPVATRIVTAADGWKYEFKDLPKYENGVEIRYGVSEEAVEGYTPSYGGSGSYDITNSYTPGKVFVEVEKSWQDNNNQDGIRPQSVTVVLVKNGTDTTMRKVLNAGNNWEAVFDDLDEYENGEKITYTVREAVVPTGYTSVVRGNIETGFIITNTHTPETTSIKGTKSWNDADDQDGKRPKSIFVHLLKAGQIYQTKVVTEEDGWKYEFTDLPKKENGVDIRYGIIEDAVAGYTPSYGQAGNYDIVNSYTPGKVSISVDKSWLDGQNQDGIRTQSVTVILVKNGTDTTNKKVLSAANNWEAVFSNLDEYESGEKITYTVREETVPTGYTAVVRGDMTTGYTITNTHEPEVVTISGTKTWDDKDDQDGKRPTEIAVQLTRNNVVIDTKTVTEETDWKYEFKDLPKYENGTEISYGIKEMAVTDYTPEYNGNDITNIHTPGKVTISVGKSWNDNNNQDGKRTEVTAVLLKNGDPTDKKVKLNEENKWFGEFKDLDEYEKGKKITYSVQEETVPEGYEATVSGSMTEGFIITNSHTPETTTVSGTKTWDDEDDRDGKRPTKITIQLSKTNSSEILDTKVVTEKDDWSYEFKDLPKYENGQEIEYRITEAAVEGYTASYDPDSYDVTNTHTPGKISITVTKSWHDDDNKDKLRTSEVTILLLADGKETGQSVVLNAGNKWTGVFEDLPEFESGKVGQEIQYTVKEKDVPKGYTSVVAGDKTKGFVVSNIHESEEPNTPDGGRNTPNGGGNTPKGSKSTKTTNTTKAAKTAKTGDAGNIVLWIVLLLAAVGVITGIVLHGRKKQKNT